MLASCWALSTLDRRSASSWRASSSSWRSRSWFHLMGFSLLSCNCQGLGEIEFEDGAGSVLAGECTHRATVALDDATAGAEPETSAGVGVLVRAEERFEDPLVRSGGDPDAVVDHPYYDPVPGLPGLDRDVRLLARADVLECVGDQVVDQLAQEHLVA